MQRKGKDSITSRPTLSTVDIYGRALRGNESIPEAKGEQREAVSVVWSRDVGSVDPWRVPS
jgi:hypothetical protein